MNMIILMYLLVYFRLDMFHMSPLKFTEIAENLDPDKPLHVSRIFDVYSLFMFSPNKLNTYLEYRILP